MPSHELRLRGGGLEVGENTNFIRAYNFTRMGTLRQAVELVPATDAAARRGLTFETKGPIL